MDKKNSNYNILNNTGFIKVILMLFVILGHSTAMWSKQIWFQQPSTPSFVLYFVHLFVGSFHIYAFTTISGYIYSYIKYEKMGYNNFFSFIKNKVERLIIPYLFTMLIFVIPIFYHFFEFNLKEFIEKFILGVAPSQLWFLLMLFGEFVLSYFIVEKMYNNLKKGIIISLILYLLGFILNHYLPNYLQISSILKYFIFFYLGTQIRHYEPKIISNKKIIITFSTIVFMLCVIMVAFIENYLFAIKYFKLLLFIINFILNISGSISAIFLLNDFALRLNYKNSKLFKTLSKYNFSIYLFHQQIIYFVINSLNGVVNNYILAILNFCVSIIISLIISILLSKIKITSKLIGIKEGDIKC